MNSYDKTYVITANEIDNNYCLSPSGLLLYLQDSIASYMSTWHAAAFDIAEDGLIWVVLEYSINVIDKVPVWSNEVKVSLSVSEITSMRTFFDFKMSDSQGHVFSVGTSVWALIDSKTRRPYIDSLEYVTKKSKISQDSLAGKHQKTRFPKSDNVVNRARYTTQITDIDFNNHVCNRTYLSVAMGCFENPNPLKDLSIKYVKETYLGDIWDVICYYAESQDTYICEILDVNNEIVCSMKISFMETSQDRDVRAIVSRK